jgi:multidrug efflux pump
MNVSAPFVHRPIATALLSAAILLAGFLAYDLLPVAPLPRVDFPTILVSGALPGASPETMASSVATPLERRFGRIAGVTEMTSSSALGSTSVTIQFDLDRDIDSAARDVQAAINAAGGELPPNLPSLPSYRKINPADAPTMIISATSETIPIDQVADAATTILAQRISQIEGVGQVFVGGSTQPAVRVRADPVALAGLGLTMEDIRARLSTSTVDSPKGVLAGDVRMRIVDANDQLFGAAAYRNLVIAGQNENAVRVRDVATVDDSVENERLAAWTNGVRSVLLVVRRQPGANIVKTNERIKAVLPNLASSISPAIKLEVAVDRTQSVRASVKDVERTLLISLGLVIFVVFIFLRSPRATAIPSVAVPLSIVGTFGIMYLLGYSLDNLSLMALTIATGFVVDDAIVVTENVTRHIELGKSPLQAALEGSKQIGFTIVSITVSLLAVFLPILLMGGIVGRLFREFAVTLSVAIAMSAVVSLTLTPMMCSRLLKHDVGGHGRLYMASERIFDFFVRIYGRSLAWAIRRHKLVGVLTLVTIGTTVALFIAIPKGLFPQQDVGQIMGMAEAPQDVSFPSMAKREEAAVKVLTTDPDINHVVAFLGGGPGGGTGNTGNVFIELKSGKRANADTIINRLRPKLAKLEGITVYLQAAQDVRVGGRSARTQYQYTIQDADLAELRAWSPRVLDRLRKLPQLKDVNTDLQVSGLELGFDIDRDTASRLGISMQQIDDTLYDAYGQRQIATTFATMNQYRVVLEAKPAFAARPESVSDVYAPGMGGPVPMSAITKLRTNSTALSISHQGQFPATTISFNLAPGAALSDAITAIRHAEADIGMPASMSADFSGTAQAYTDSLKSEPWLILAALITVYIVLGVLYESYVHPITILSTLPSAGVGALVALLVTKTEFSIIALIGIILLIGIVKKNAIMMIDFAIEAEREEGLSSEEAITKAALLRFRPIMMTTLAALFGAVPLTISTEVGSELRRPLGIAIIGGLLFSQALTLFTTPVIYLALDQFTKRKRRADELAST